MRRRRPRQPQRPRLRRMQRPAAQAKADAEAKKKAEEEAKKAATLITAPVAARSVSYSAEYLATDAIKANATALGSYKLTFYCPCEICNGALGVGQTASGAAPAEGRTIAGRLVRHPARQPRLYRGLRHIHCGGHRQRDQEQQDRHLRFHAFACRKSLAFSTQTYICLAKRKNWEPRFSGSFCFLRIFSLQRRRKFAIIRGQGCEIP